MLTFSISLPECQRKRGQRPQACLVGAWSSLHARRCPADLPEPMGMVWKAGALGSSGHPEVLPQLLALSFSTKSPFGVSGGVLSRTSEANNGEGSVLDQPIQNRHQPRKGASFGGRNERQHACRSLCSTNAKIH